MADPAKVLLPSTQRGIPLSLVLAADWPRARDRLDAPAKAWAEANGFTAQAGRFIAVPGPKGEIAQVLAGTAAPSESDAFALSRLCRSLPAGDYRLEGETGGLHLFALGWCLEAYSFEAHGKTSPPPARSCSGS